mgnify:CR=1 FL=1
MFLISNPSMFLHFQLDYPAMLRNQDDWFLYHKESTLALLLPIESSHQFHSKFFDSQHFLSIPVILQKEQSTQHILFPHSILALLLCFRRNLLLRMVVQMSNILHY